MRSLLLACIALIGLASCSETSRTTRGCPNCPVVCDTVPCDTTVVRVVDTIAVDYGCVKCNETEARWVCRKLGYTEVIEWECGESKEWCNRPCLEWVICAKSDTLITCDDAS